MAYVQEVMSCENFEVNSVTDISVHENVRKCAVKACDKKTTKQCYAQEVMSHENKEVNSGIRMKIPYFIYGNKRCG